MRACLCLSAYNAKNKERYRYMSVVRVLLAEEMMKPVLVTPVQS